MKAQSGTVLTLLGLALLGFAALGCSEGTTRKDVATSRQNLDEAKQNTADAVRDNQNNINGQSSTAQEHTAAKPITPDNTTMPQQGTAGLQQNANDRIANAQEKERAAAADLKTKEQEYQATQERDNFVKQAEQKLGDYDKRIDELNQQASNAQAPNKDAINRQIDAVKSSRDRAKKALDDLKGADLMAWKNHQDHVRMAFQELDNSVKNVK